MIPACSKVGNRPMQAVAPPIMAMVIRKVYFRPTRSPNQPNTSAPSGRKKKPMAKANRLNSSSVVGLPVAKNSLPSRLARMP